MLHVPSRGSDANPGTPQAPLRSILRASQLARPGTTVIVARGIYASGFKTTASGSVGARISYVSATRWGARIVPPASLAVSAAVRAADPAASAAWDNRGNYVDIVGFDIDGRGVLPGRPGVMASTTAAPLPAGGRNVAYRGARRLVHGTREQSGSLDFRYNNPRNAQVRRVARAELRAFWPGQHPH